MTFGTGGIVQVDKTTSFSGQGLAGTLLQLWASRRAAKAQQKKEMELLETLSLGGKLQLMLVRCAGERFLLVGSLDRIESVARLGVEEEDSADEAEQCG
jgi:flagellar biogenesis protein FliO